MCVPHVHSMQYHVIKMTAFMGKWLEAHTQKFHEVLERGFGKRPKCYLFIPTRSSYVYMIVKMLQ